MSEHIKSAEDRLEMVRLMTQKLAREEQPREEMLNNLELAKAEINNAMNELELVEEFYNER